MKTINLMLLGIFLAITSSAHAQNEDAKKSSRSSAVKSKAQSQPTAYVLSRLGRIDEPGVMISKDEILYVLFIKDPCTIEGMTSKAEMHAAAMLQGIKLAPACWVKTLSPLSDKFVIITKFGYKESRSLFSFTEAIIDRDGNGTSIKPAISMEEMQKRTQEYQKSLY